MRKLFATCYAGKWWVSCDRVSGRAPISGEGNSLPAAYLDYLRTFERVTQRNKAVKAEEQRCIAAIIKMQEKKPEPVVDPQYMVYHPSKRWWQFWK